MSDFGLSSCLAADGIPVWSGTFPAAGGEPQGTALLVHGFGQNLLTWHSETRSFCRFLSNCGWQVEAIELRGHGTSRRHGGSMARSLAEHLELDLGAVVDDLLKRNVPQPIVPIGHSLGGLMACNLLRRYPGLFPGTVAIASPGRMKFAPVLKMATLLPPVCRRVPLLLNVLAHIPFPLDRLGQFTALVVKMGGEPLMPDKPKPWMTGSMEEELIQDRVTRGFDRTSMAVIVELADWVNSGRLAVPGVTDDLVRDFAKVTEPVLLVSSPDDAVVPPGLALRARAFPNATVRTHAVEGFGHCDIILGKRAPARIWNPILEWLSGI